MSTVQVPSAAPGVLAADRLGPLLGEVSARAAAVDRGVAEVRPVLARLGAAGLLASGVEGRPGTLVDQAAVIRALARECLSTAFATWAQRMTIGYVAGWGGDELRTRLLPELIEGTRPGATALAGAFQDVLGVRGLPVTAERRDGEVVLTGTIPWASNLFPDGTLVVLPARSPAGERLIVALTTDLAGVELAPYPRLLALGATASTSVRLAGVRVPRSWVVTTRYVDFLADVRPSFLLLQTAFCLGLVDASLTGAEGRFEGFGSVLAADHEQLARQRADLNRRHAHLLDAGGPAGVEHLRLRLEAGTLAVHAARHESTVRGGVGYLATSPVARRAREAAFLPIQSPTEAQLRWELSRSA